MGVVIIQPWQCGPRWSKQNIPQPAQTITTLHQIPALGRLFGQNNNMRFMLNLHHRTMGDRTCVHVMCCVDLMIWLTWVMGDMTITDKPSEELRLRHWCDGWQPGNDMYIYVLLFWYLFLCIGGRRKFSNWIPSLLKLYMSMNITSPFLCDLSKQINS